MSLLTEQDIAFAWLGTNDPIALGGNFKDSEHVKNFAANLEAAWLAKLASAELPTLPEPSEVDGARWGYTSDDMRNYAVDAYAQGAAAQITRLGEKDGPNT